MKSFARSVVAALAMLLAAAAQAQQTQTIRYMVDGQEHVGFRAMPEGVGFEEGQVRAPGVLIVPEWWGVNDFARDRARALAQAGYVVFVADMYGQGRSTQDPKQAGQWATQARQDRQHWRTLATAALDVLRQQPGSDDDRLAVIGFCFGGGTAVETTYANPAGLRAAVSFHGGPMQPLPDDAAPQANILILHGADDPLDKLADIIDLTQALTDVGAVWQLHAFSGAQHSFMNPDAGKAGIAGVQYDARAAGAAWEQMLVFFDRVLKP